MKKLFPILVFVLLAGSACDPARIYDEHKTIPDHAWYYQTGMPFEVPIRDTNIWYNVYINLRVSSDYKYNNLFLWLHTTSPDNQTDKRRVEIRLADEHGKWLGSGLGDLYDYQFPAIQKVRFPASGFYRFDLFQNMRDDTLQNIISAGIRVERYIEPEEVK